MPLPPADADASYTRRRERLWAEQGIVAAGGAGGAVRPFLWGDYLALLERQSGRCGVCGRAFTARVRTPHVDHDHYSGQARSVAHQACNQEIVGAVERLARLRGTTPALAARFLVEYLERGQQ